MVPTLPAPSRPRAETAILIVEDEKIVAHDLARLIGDMGYWVMGTAKSGEEALAITARQRPDLVLMDIHLKGGSDGIAAVAALRARWDVPVVYLTAFADDEILARARATEPLGYLVKPVKDHDLKAAVEMALYKHAADSKLRQRERWFATTLRSVGDAVLAVDPSLRVTFLNAEAERLTGTSTAAAAGRPVGEVLNLVDERTRARCENPLVRALANRRTESGHALLVGCGGQASADCPIESSAAPIMDDAEVLGAVLVFRDVSRKRKLEEQFIVADRLVALGTLAGGVAHEINNPLTLILNNAHFTALELGELKRALADGGLSAGEGVRRIDEMLSAMNDVNQGARRAAAIIEDMRGFSAHEPSARELVDLRATVEWAARMSMAQILPRAKLELDLPPVLPSVLANRTRIAQVFINILVNAAQAIPESQPRQQHRVGVVGRVAEGGVTITISDTGVGMSREVRQRVFEPFFTTKAPGGGSGLGMAVAHGIVTGLGGRIEIESAEGKGTSVSVYLPTPAR